MNEDEKRVMRECIREALLEPEFVAAFSKAFFDMPVPEPRSEIISLQTAALSEDDGTTAE